MPVATSAHVHDGGMRMSNRALDVHTLKQQAAGKLISAVCHGAEGFVNVKGPDGKPLVAGK